MSRATVYVSGPMTGYEDWNRPAFHAAARHLRAKGYAVVNPAELDDGMSDVELAETPHSTFLRRDIRVLLDCDLIYLLPGWKHSKGATLEKAVADGTGIDRLLEADVELWRSFEGEPVPENPDACDNTTCRCFVTPVVDTCPAFHTLGEGCTYPMAGDRPAGEAPSQGHPTAGTEDLSAGLGVDVEVDPSLPPNTIRFETPAGTLDFEAHWEGHDLRLERKPEEHYLPGDAFPNVGYVRRMLGVTAAQLAENVRRAALTGVMRLDPADVDFGDADDTPGARS